MNNKSQERNCIFCKNSTNTNLDICSICKKDPYLVDEYRDYLAKKGDTYGFKLTYSYAFGQIKNINKNTFWNKHFKNEYSLNEQDMMTKKKISKIVSLLPKTRFNLLDLGFGQGYLEEELLLRQKIPNIYGIDISNQAIQKAEKKFKGKYILGNILKMRSLLGKRSFDIITAIELIEHISPTDILKFFTDAHLLLRKNGAIILSTPLNENLKNADKNPSGHVREYTVSILKTELRLCGFEVKEIKTFYAFKSHYKIKNLIAKIIPNHWQPNNVVVMAIKI